MNCLASKSDRRGNAAAYYLTNMDPNCVYLFSEKPFTLRQWQVLDAQGTLTTVTLNNARTGMALDDKLFEFDEDASPD